LEEIWKDIKEYKGKYQVSNTGKVKRGNTLLNPYDNGKGYLNVSLYFNKRNITARVNRLVAQEFVENPNNYKFVNHKDENKKNNNVDNLEWCTIKYNNNYGNRIKKYKQKRCKKILQYDLNNCFIKEWDSMSEIAEKFKISISGIRNCAIGKFRQFKGFVWKYK
jgi:hypothetical protein